jgi:energy-coupling factor transport system ATP-binding protein
VIRLEGYSYTYPQTSVPALSGINLEIPEGQFCAVIGANGAGTSTLCFALTGFVPHFYRGTVEGTASVAGKDVKLAPLSELAGEIALVFANPFNQISGARFTVREEIAFGLENLGLPRDQMLARVDETMALTGLMALAERSPYALSGGQQQRLAIASVLAMRPRVLVLDEPTSQIDPVGTREVYAVLRALVIKGDTTVVLVEHKLEWAAVYAHRVILLAGGQIVRDGVPAEVLASPDLEQHGVKGTRYTAAARKAQGRGLVSRHKALPVTLEQAVGFFQ